MELPLALRYSALCNSSIVSRASASSLAKACSSSYSPGLPIRSSMILPRFVYLKKKKTARTSTATPAEPKADKTPINIPRPVEPVSLMFITIDVGAPLSPCDSGCCPLPDTGSVDVGIGDDGGGGADCRTVVVRLGIGST